MGDIDLIDFGGGDPDDRARREREDQRLRAAWAHRLAEHVPLTDAVARQIVSLVFDHADRSGRSCSCGCHPRLSSQHDGGWDCPCTWDDERREREYRSWVEPLDDLVTDELRQEHEAEQASVTAWVIAHDGVSATRLTSYAPEQWEGVVDGHSFYFRARHGHWRLEIDLEPTGDFANRIVDVDSEGGLVTEPVPIERGEVIAEGFEDALGPTPVDHLGHIVTAVRRHLGQQQCPHPGGVFFCPICGAAC